MRLAEQRGHVIAAANKMDIPCNTATDGKPLQLIAQPALTSDDEVCVGVASDDGLCRAEQHRNVLDRMAKIGDECYEPRLLAGIWQGKVQTSVAGGLPVA